MFEIGLSEVPVIRDGRTTDLTYVILACKTSEVYNCVVWGTSSSKLKFYPDAEFWGITPGVLNKIGVCPSIYSRQGYQGITASAQNVAKVLDAIRFQRHTQVVPTGMFLEWEKTKSPREFGLHPRTHGTPTNDSLKRWEGPRVVHAD